MGKDVAPGLWREIKKKMESGIENDPVYQSNKQKIDEGKGDYKAAHECAIRVGEHTSAALRSTLKADELPDGRLYYNIADRTVRPAMEQEYDTVAGLTRTVQATLNEQNGIGMKVVEPSEEETEDRIKGIVDKVSEAENFEDVSWALGEPVKQFSQSTVDRFVKANCEKQAQSGLHPRVVREAEAGACKWCLDLAGTYDVGSEPREIYQRHDDCRCTVEYDGTKLRAYDGGDGYNTFNILGDLETRREYGLQEEMLTPEERLKRTPKTEIVTSEYLKNARPNSGKITPEPGYDLNVYKQEFENATWMQKQFGGDIVLRNKNDVSKTADYYWEKNKIKENWEQKTLYSPKAIDGALRDSLHKDNGIVDGILLEVKTSLSDKKIEEAINYRLKRSARVDVVDIIVRREDNYIVFRWKNK